MFEHLEPARPDPILGLTEAFNNDNNPTKVNLSVGVYQDANGKTPILATVKEAEARLLRDEQTKGYLPISGDPEFGRAVQQLMLGRQHEIVVSCRAATAATPGGTGALRVAGEFIRAAAPAARIWLSDPTWPNHRGVFEAAGLEINSYPYFDAGNNGLALDAMLDVLANVPAGDVVLLHGCCHNPSGIDPTPEQWRQIADVVHDRRLLPLVDFAYQGFGDGLDEDAVGLRQLCREGRETLICSSFSKNFGLYCERTGALTLVGSSAESATTAMGHLKLYIRTNYSNPPAHGGAIVTTILADDALRSDWIQELGQMRQRINDMRRLFVETLAAKGVERDFSFIARQRGMFSFSGLTGEQVAALRENNSIYIVGSGRINVAGMTEQNMDVLCDAMAAILS